MSDLSQRSRPRKSKFTLALALGVIVHYLPYSLHDQNLWPAHAWVLLTLLALAHQLDLRLRTLLTQTEGAYDLDESGLKLLREEMGLEAELVGEFDLNHDDDCR